MNVTGNIASGATTLCQKLCEHLGWKPFFSQAHKSPFLKELYENSGRFAFQNQLYIIVQSLKQQMQLDSVSGTVCQDYTIYEHNAVYTQSMFELGEINSNELTLLGDIFELLRQNYEGRKPDLLIYLIADPDTLAKRVVKRGRIVEKNVKKEYLEILQHHFDSFIKSWQICPILRLDSTKLDISSREELDKIATIIKELN